MSLFLVLLDVFSEWSQAVYDLLFSLALFASPRPQHWCFRFSYTEVCVGAVSLFRAASYSIVSGLHFIFPFLVDDIGWLFAFVNWEKSHTTREGTSSVCVS